MAEPTILPVIRVERRTEIDDLRDALKEIIALDQREKRTLIKFDPAGSTYGVEKIDGPCAAIARAALHAEGD